VKNKVRRSDKSCPECNKWLYWIEEEEEDSDGHIKPYRYLECLSCGYIIEPARKKSKKKIMR
jgi:DNA-directed RNA polymerase subunit M/transcription elongation factor TFIIS